MMVGYYLDVTLHSLRRNAALTTLTVLCIGIGIGAATTALAIARADAADPIPDKSAQLFAPQIDNWGVASSADLPDQLSYLDALGLLHAHAARRQAAMYPTSLILSPANPQLPPQTVVVRATTSDFFSMFKVPLRYGSGWNVTDDDARAHVVVIGNELNDRLFGGANSLGQTLVLNDREYRIVGVLNRWKLYPRFYDSLRLQSPAEDVFLPFSLAIDSQMQSLEGGNCHGHFGPGWEGKLGSDCVWIQFWAELPTAADASRYRSFLSSYALEQKKVGRFSWNPRVELRDVRQWLDYHHVVDDGDHMLLLLGFGFLLACLLNSVGLILAKFVASSADIGLRRALGASRRVICIQCLAEVTAIGVMGGLLGLGFAELGLMGVRRALYAPDADTQQLVELWTHLDLADVGVTALLAVGATLVAGVYPAWRATRTQAARLLVAQ
jgi:putative ABC transport system permease protein